MIKNNEKLCIKKFVKLYILELNLTIYTKTNSADSQLIGT